MPMRTASTMLFLLACPFSVSFPILPQLLLPVLPAHYPACFLRALVVCSSFVRMLLKWGVLFLVPAPPIPFSSHS